MRTAGGTAGGTAALAATGGVAAQEEGGDGGGGGPPDYGGWFGNVGNFGGETVDATGQSEVTITVGASGNGGNLAFDPPAVHVDAGTTVVWEWNGQGGTHNVVADAGTYDSGTAVAEEGTTFEYTFEEDGISKYYCSPHEGLGMKGAVVVGTDYPIAAPAGGGSTEVNPEHMGVPFQAHFVGIATILAILVSLLFTFFTLKYGESPNTKGGNN